VFFFECSLQEVFLDRATMRPPPCRNRPSHGAWHRWAPVGPAQLCCYAEHFRLPRNPQQPLSQFWFVLFPLAWFVTEPNWLEGVRGFFLKKCASKFCMTEGPHRSRRTRSAFLFPGKSPQQPHQPCFPSARRSPIPLFHDGKKSWATSLSR